MVLEKGGGMGTYETGVPVRIRSRCDGKDGCTDSRCQERKGAGSEGNADERFEQVVGLDGALLSSPVACEIGAQDGGDQEIYDDVRPRPDLCRVEDHPAGDNASSEKDCGTGEAYCQREVVRIWRHRTDALSEMVPQAAVPRLADMPIAMTHVKIRWPPIILEQRIAMKVWVNALVRP